MARTKKTFIKDGRITRTITFTSGNVVSLDRKTREVQEKKVTLPMEYDVQEFEAAVSEMGYKGAFVEGKLEITTALFEMAVSDFITYGHIVTDVPDYVENIDD